MRQIGAVGEEAHVLDEMGAGDFDEMLGQGTAGRYGRTAPVVANETDRVIDCESRCCCSAEQQEQKLWARNRRFRVSWLLPLTAAGGCVFVAFTLVCLLSSRGVQVHDVSVPLDPQGQRVCLSHPGKGGG